MADRHFDAQIGYKILSPRVDRTLIDTVFSNLVPRGRDPFGQRRGSRFPAHDDAHDAKGTSCLWGRG